MHSANDKGKVDDKYKSDSHYFYRDPSYLIRLSGSTAFFKKKDKIRRAKLSRTVG